MKKNTPLRIWLLFGVLLASLFIAACTGAGGIEPAADEQTTENMAEMEEMDHEEMEEMDHEHADAPNRIPNENGAAITIISPQAGATFSTLEQVLVQVDVENFDLGVDGNHWHVYVDGVSFGMVMGGNMDQALPGLEPGEREVSVFLSIGSHEEYEDGDSVTIVVEE